MNKFYRLIGFVFVIVVIMVTVFLLVFQRPIREYLSAMNDINTVSDKSLVQRPKVTELTPGQGPINVTLLSNPKYKNLKKSVVDLTGINLPGQDVGTSTPTSTLPQIKEPEPLPDYKVGNENPFKPF